MIRAFTPVDETFLREKSNTFGIYEIKIYSQYETYGATSGILDLWRIDRAGVPVGFASRLSGALTFAAPAADPVECVAFAQAVGCVTAEGDSPLLTRGDAVPHDVCNTSWVLRHAGAAAQRADGVPGVPTRAARLDEVCALHRAATPGFAETVNPDAWLTEASHKQRHGLAEYYLLRVDGEAVATASILFHGKGQAILGAIATHPAHRGRGYGNAVVTHALAVCRERGWQPWLFAREDALLDFYRPQGFVPAGRWTRLSMIEMTDKGRCI